MRLHASRYEEDSELSTEIERFKIDIKNSGGFEVGHYPLRDQAQIYCTWICKYYDIPNKPLSAIAYICKSTTLFLSVGSLLV